MEQYYIKRGKRYVEAGYNCPDMAEGLYWKQKTVHGSRTTSVMHWAGSTPPQPLDIQKLITIMSEDDRLAQFLMKCQDETSEEFQQVKDDQGGYVTNPLKLYNWSAQDLAQAILRFAFKEMENEHCQSDPA